VEGGGWLKPTPRNTLQLTGSNYFSPRDASLSAHKLIFTPSLPDEHLAELLNYKRLNGGSPDHLTAFARRTRPA
jgi:hypothetical protein